MNKLRPFTLAISWSGLGSVSSALVAMVKLYLLSRLLEPSDFGVLAIAQIGLSLSGLFVDSGTSVGFLHRQETSQAEFNSLVWWNIFVATGFYIVISLVTPYIAYWYEEPILEGVLWTLSLSLPIGAIGLQFRVARQKALDFKYITVVNLGGNLINLFTTVILAWLGWGVYALVAGQLLQAGITSTAFVYGYRVMYPMRFYFRFALLQPYLRIGLYHTGGQLLNTFTRDLDTLIIGRYFGMETLGAYDLLKRLAARPLQLINPLFSKVYIPTLARLQLKLTEFSRTYLAALEVIAGLQVPIYLGMIAVAEPLILFFYGPTYATYSIVFQWISGYFLARALIKPFGDLVIAKGKTSWEFYWNIIYSLIGFIIILLSARISLLVLAQCLCVYLILLLPLSYVFFVRPLTNINPQSYSIALLKPLLSGGLMAVLLAYILGLLGAINPTVVLIFNLAFGAVAYWSFRAIGEGLNWVPNLWRELDRSSE